MHHLDDSTKDSFQVLFVEMDRDYSTMNTFCKSKGMEARFIVWCLTLSQTSPGFNVSAVQVF